MCALYFSEYLHNRTVEIFSRVLGELLPVKIKNYVSIFRLNFACPPQKSEDLKKIT